MSASVSFANVVASGTTTPTLEAATPAAPVTPVEDSEKTQEPAEAVVAEQPEEEKDEESKGQDQLPSPAASPKAEKAAVNQELNLAPAPVPTVSAWGSSPSSVESSRSNSNIDTKYWPSPIESKEVAVKQEKKKASSVKVGNEKWVPFKASVVIAQPGSKKSNGNKRNNTNNTSNKSQSNSKKQANPTASAITSVAPPPSADSKKKGKKTDGKPSAKETKPQQSKDQAEESKPEQISSEQQPEEEQTQQHQEQQQQPEEEEEEQQQQQLQHNNNIQQQHHHHHKQHRHNTNNHNNQHYIPQLQANGQQFYAPNGQQQSYNSAKPYNNQYPQKRYNKYSNSNGQANGYNRPYNPHYHNNNGNQQYNPYHNNNSNTHSNHRQHFHARHYTNKDAEPLFSLIKQVEYYFSVENLVKDVFLRKQMNSEGWLNYNIIANFYRMNVLSGGDSQLIRKVIDELNGSLLDIAVFQNDLIKLRVKENYKQWVLPFEQRVDNGKDENELVQIIEPVKKEEKEEEQEQQQEHQQEEAPVAKEEEETQA